MKQQSNDNINSESSQEFLARVRAKGYQSLLVSPDDSPLTLKEHLQLILSDIDEASPDKPLGELIVKFLKALPAISESLEARPDYTDQLNEIINLWKETNRHRAKEKPHQSDEEV